MEFTNIPPMDPGQQPEEDAVYYVDEAVVVTPDAAEQTPPAQPQPPAGAVRQKKPWNKRIILAAVAAVAVLALIVVVIVSAVGNSPVKLVGDSIGNALSSAGDNELLATMEKALEGGSFAMELPVNDLTQWLFYGYGSPTVGEDGAAGTLSVKAYTDLPNGNLALTAQAPFAGEALNASFYVDADQGTVALSLPELLDDTYGVNVKKLRQTLPESFLAPNSGSFALDEETFDQLLQQLEQFDGDVQKQNEALVKQVRKTADKLLSELLKNVEEYAEIEKTNDEVTFVSSTAKVTRVQIAIDGAAMSKILKTTCKWAYESKDVEQTVTDICEQYAAQLAAALEEPTADAKELAEEFYDDLYDMIDMCDEIEDAWEDTELALEFYITKSGKRLVKLDVQLEGDGEDTQLTLTAGPTLAEPELIRVQYDDEWESYDVTYSVEENTAKQYSAKLRAKEDGKTVSSASVSWDKKAGDLRVKYEDEYESVLVKGSLLLDRKSAVLYIRSITSDDDIVKPDLTLTVLTSDKMPQTPEYTEFLLLSEEELASLAEQLQQRLYALMGLTY